MIQFYRVNQILKTEVRKTDNEAVEECTNEVNFLNFVVDKADNMKIIDCDKHFSDFVGVHPSKIKRGKIFLNDIIKPLDRERVFQAICKKHTRFIYLDFDILDKTKTPVFVHCTGENYEDSTYCRLTLVDVMERRKNQVNSDFSADQIRHLIEQINGGICLFKVSQDMQIEALYLNAECCRIFGTSKENYNKQDYRLNELIHPDDRSAVFQGIGKTMATGEPFDLECRVIVHKNEFIWCNLNAGILSYDESKCPVFHAVFTDITRIKEVEKKTE